MCDLIEKFSERNCFGGRRPPLKTVFGPLGKRWEIVLNKCKGWRSQAFITAKYKKYTNLLWAGLNFFLYCWKCRSWSWNRYFRLSTPFFLEHLQVPFLFIVYMEYTKLIEIKAMAMISLWLLPATEMSSNMKRVPVPKNDISRSQYCPLASSLHHLARFVTVHIFKVQNQCFCYHCEIWHEL